MKYYKIIKDNNFIGACSSRDFIKYLIRNHCYITSDEYNGEYVECNGKVYRDTWMPPVPNESIISFEQAIILETTKEEYDAYIEAIENNEEIIHEDIDWQEPVIINNDITNDISIDFIRQSKLSEMSYSCRQAIESGFDLELRGETKHFSLTTQDQLNLISLSVMAQTQSLIPYHADGEETDFYTREEINLIVEAANALKIQHTTYYNALKTYINALETIEEISAITYGVEIPDEYKSDVLKVLEQ